MLKKKFYTFDGNKNPFFMQNSVIVTKNSLRNFTKPHYFNATVEQALFVMAEDADKILIKKFSENFVYQLAARGESLEHCLRTLREKGFILNRSTVSRWRRGLLPNFNSFQFTVLAQYVGYPDFVALINANPAGVEG